MAYWLATATADCNYSPGLSASARGPAKRKRKRVLALHLRIKDYGYSLTFFHNPLFSLYILHVLPVPANQLVLLCYVRCGLLKPDRGVCFVAISFMNAPNC